MSEQQHLSSPLATGGSGTFFEQHVCAQFLALLLLRAIPPILKDCQVQEVHFQAEHLGWNTDDVLIIGSRGGDSNRKLATQVKRQFTISDKNAECKKAFVDFWKDFKNSTIFNRRQDRLALITLRGTDTLLSTFNSLLDCARASTDGTDFARRLALDGLWSKKARGQAETIKSIITEYEGEAPRDNDFWQFLSVLNVISFDLNTPTAQNEVWTKALLAHTSNEGDPIASAEATWRELLEIVGSSSTGMPAAASYKYDTLPDYLRTRHSALQTSDSLALQSLVTHSRITIDSIRTTIANTITINRDEQVAQILVTLDQSQIVVLTGPAGAGKSVLAKSTVEILHTDYFCLAFRAEEFATSHIDRTLQHVNNSLTAERLVALLAAQGRKIILVESIERLLEASVRDAFSDLLRIVQRDNSIQLLLTCRDYSVDIVRTSLLEQIGVTYQTIEVPRLTEDELAQVIQAITPLTNAVQNTKLKDLLRSPYLLDKATRVNWRNTEPLPSSERDFRTRCWREVIRSDVNTAKGMPQRRDRVFVEIALRRARELRPYVLCSDLDQEALDALRKDDLITVSNENDDLAAPAHDVLEDWAIIQWIARQFSIREGQVIDFAGDIGGYPAIRRGYRKWLSELLECAPDQADSFVLSSFQEETLPAFFRDDTLVSMLLASSAPTFLNRNRAFLLAQDHQLLIRVIHLLRIACKTTPSWLDGYANITSRALEPSGEAWVPILKLVSDEIDTLLPQNLGILLGLVEDWSRWVNIGEPEPPGFQEVGKIAYKLLEHVADYDAKGERKRVLEIIAKIPKADEDAFKELLQRGCLLDRDDEVASDFAELLLTELSSYACKDFPEQMIELATAHCCLSDKDLQDYFQDPLSHSFSIGTEPHFGIREHTHLDCFPASALQGPFLPLLRSHPHLGVQFIIDLLNHACTWYGEQKWPEDQLEPAWKITIEIPGIGQRTLWANWRLYGLYRGTSVGPYVLQSALMALEHWFLLIGEFEKVDLEGWLLKVLKDSNNVATAAVVASVCNAYPEKSGRAPLALLSSQEIIVLDRGRMGQDLTPSLANYIPSPPDKQIYDEERKKTDAHSHRKFDLEALAVKLQFTELREDVWKILDDHRAVLPPLDEQSEEHRLWRLALHRMDIRGFQVGEEVPPSEIAQDIPESDVQERRYYSLRPAQIEPDVQEMVDQSSRESAQIGSDLSLLNWGKTAWDREKRNDDNLRPWQEMLAAAKERNRPLQEQGIEKEQRESLSWTYGGPTLIAAVCVRDHWEKMSQEDQQWCIEKLVAEIDYDSDTNNDSTRHSRGGLFPDRQAAYVLPGLLGKSTTEGSNARIITAIAKALTHAVTEVAEYAAEGVGYYLHSSSQWFALQCVGALCKQARLMEEVRSVEKSKPFQDQLRGEIRRSIEAGEVDVEYELEQLNFQEWVGRMAAQSILQILGYFTNSPLAVQFHLRVAEYLLGTWNEYRQNRRRSNRRDYSFESFCTNCVAKFALKQQATEALLVCTPLLEAVPDHPSEVAKFIKALIYAEDGLEQETSFWDIWQVFIERLYGVSWLQSLDTRYGNGANILYALFFGVDWKEGVHHWRRLEGQSHRIDTFVKQLPVGSVVIEAYCRFLYRIGGKSLPDGFVTLAERLKSGKVDVVLSNSNTVFYLESLLRRYVYGEPLRLKSNPKYRSAVLYILDQLVEAGSSTAYRMRDDFVTPISREA